MGPPPQKVSTRRLDRDSAYSKHKSLRTRPDSDPGAGHLSLLRMGPLRGMFWEIVTNNVKLKCRWDPLFFEIAAKCLPLWIQDSQNTPVRSAGHPQSLP